MMDLLCVGRQKDAINEVAPEVGVGGRSFHDRPAKTGSQPPNSVIGTFHCPLETQHTTFNVLYRTVGPCRVCMPYELSDVLCAQALLAAALSLTLLRLILFAMTPILSFTICISVLL